MVSFYRGATESILTGNIACLHGLCMTQDRKTLQWVIQNTQNITGASYRVSANLVKWDVCTEPNRYSKTTSTPATVCSPCCQLAKDKVSTDIPPDYRAASFFRLWDSWTHSQHSIVRNRWSIYAVNHYFVSDIYQTLSYFTKTFSNSAWLFFTQWPHSDFSPLLMSKKIHLSLANIYNSSLTLVAKRISILKLFCL